MQEEKQFDLWNENKKNIDKRKFTSIYCKKREIWTCKLGENIGNELSKNSPFIRPVLIINSFLGGDLILIFPLTTKYFTKYNNFLFELDTQCGLKYKSYIALNQIRVISKKRLIKKVIDDIGEKKFNNITKKFKKNIKI